MNVQLYYAVLGLMFLRCSCLPSVSSYCPVSEKFPLESPCHSSNIIGGQNFDFCSKRWLIIIATGRSGSTTVMDTLNVIPGIKLAGEHYGVIAKLRDYYVEYSKLKPEGDGGAWLHAKLNHTVPLVRFQQLIMDMHPDPAAQDTLLGFKEIRYSSEPMIHFLKLLFPCSRFIFNYRKNFEQQAKSGFYRDGHRRNIQKLALLNREVVKLAKLYPETSYLLPLEDFSVDKFNGLLSWIGYDKDCRFSTIAHSNKHNGYVSDSMSVMYSGNCTTFT